MYKLVLAAEFIEVCEFHRCSPLN